MPMTSEQIDSTCSLLVERLRHPHLRGVKVPPPTTTYTFGVDLDIIMVFSKKDDLDETTTRFVKDLGDAMNHAMLALRHELDSNTEDDVSVLSIRMGRTLFTIVSSLREYLPFLGLSLPPVHSTETDPLAQLGNLIRDLGPYF